VESYVKTPSNGKKTVTAMGVGNLLSGFFGGMGGNAMIGLSTINVLNGGRGRLAPCTTAFIVFAAVAGAYEALNYIPVSALAGIMLVVVLHTFKWFSVGIMVSSVMPSFVRNALHNNCYSFERKIPRIEAFTILLVTLCAYFLNIAYAVGAGLALCAIHFAWSSMSTFDVKEKYVDGKKIYEVNGPLYFTSANAFVKILKPETDPEVVEVRFGYASVMDYTAIATMHKLSCAYKDQGKKITFHSLNQTSQNLILEGKTLVGAIEYTTVEHEVQSYPDASSQAYNEGAGYTPNIMHV
jgi:SulP family sulfate permease